MIVFEYFFEKMPYFGPLMDEQEEQEKASHGKAKTGVRKKTTPGVQNTNKALTRSLVLAVGVCYHARLSDRKEYENGVAKEFTTPLALPGGKQQFRNEIRW